MKPSIRSSELDRILSCNGSITVTRMVDPRDGDEGHEGTMVHWMIADRLIRELGATPPEGGLPAPDVPKGYTLPKNSLWMVDWAVRHVRETVPPDWSLMVEVEMSATFARWTNTGHADVVAISPDGKKALGMDWKTGRDPVDPADNNEQTASYSGLAYLEWPTIEEMEFQICQPRVSEEDGFERVSRVTITNLPALVESMDRRVCAAIDNALKLKTGKQCKYCVGCSCPAIQAEQKLMELTLTPEILATIKQKPDDAQLAEFVIIGRRLEKPLKDATEMLHKRLDSNPTVMSESGVQVTRKVQKGAWSWPDPVAAFAAVRELLPTDESMAKVTTLSVTRVQDEIANVMGVPKAGGAAVSAASVFQAKVAPHGIQGDRNLLQFL